MCGQTLLFIVIANCAIVLKLGSASWQRGRQSVNVSLPVTRYKTASLYSSLAAEALTDVGGRPHLTTASVDNCSLTDREGMEG